MIKKSQILSGFIMGIILAAGMNCRVMAKDTDDEIFVIGGGSIYKYMLPYAKCLYLTEIDAEPEADTYFPEFDRKDYTKETLKTGSEGELNFEINRYERK